MMNNIIFFIESPDKVRIFYSGQENEGPKDELLNYIEKIGKKVKSAHILISDKFVYSINEIFSVKSKKDALNAAKYKLESIFHTHKIKSYLSYFQAKKTENGYSVKIFYTENDFSEIIGQITSFYERKLKSIRPAFDIFYNKSYEGYAYKDDYITVFEKDLDIATFPKEKINFDLSSKNIVEVTSLSSYLGNIDKDEPVVNFRDNKNIFSINNIFMPIITLLVVINLIAIGYLSIKYPKAKKTYEEIKALNLKKAQELEPLRKMIDEKADFEKKIELYKKFVDKKSYVSAFISDLAKDNPDIWIQNFRYRSPKLNVRVSNIKSQDLIDYLKSKKYINSVSIKGGVSVYNDKESFNLEVTFAE